jgi:hypothetical protein
MPEVGRGVGCHTAEDRQDHIVAHLVGLQSRTMVVGKFIRLHNRLPGAKACQFRTACRERTDEKAAAGMPRRL